MFFTLSKCIPVQPLITTNLISKAKKIAMDRIKQEKARNNGVLSINMKFMERFIPVMKPIMAFYLVNEKQIKLMTEFKDYALSTYFEGSRVFNMFEEIMRIPPEYKIKRQTEKDIELCDGHNDSIMRLVRLKLKNLKTLSKTCVLCIHETPVKPHLYYNITKDRIVGFEQSNGGRKPIAAKQALVIMARGLYDNWEQLMAYQFISK